MNKEVQKAKRSEVIDYFTSVARILFRLVRAPIRIARKGKRQLRRVVYKVALRKVDLLKLETLLENGSEEQAEYWVRENSGNRIQLGAYLTRLSRLLVMRSPETAIRLGREVVALDPQPHRSRWLGILLFDAGHIVEAAELLTSVDAHTLTASGYGKVQYIRGCAELRRESLAIPKRATCSFSPEPMRVLYVASSSLPFHVSGYTTRTHSILKTLRSQGWDASCVTRPGYPADRDDALQTSDDHKLEVDGVSYTTLPGPNRRQQPLNNYLLESADILEAYARDERPAVIHAASNYEAALPALIAARRLGVPFIYEVRGLWEYTAASKRSGWEATERFALDRQLESLAASEADAVLTLTNAMANELVERGVTRERISLAPNGVDPSVFERRPFDAGLATELGLRPGVFTIGYIGSIVSYEGLEDLIKAFQLLCNVGIDSRLVVVGDGKSLAGLKALAEKLEVSDRVIFTGRVSHVEVPRYFSILDAIAIPRKPYKVCQLVSPLKPLEAMAIKVPLVVSDVPALAEMITDGETGLIHKADDPTSLFKSLTQLASSKELRSQLADTAYHHVLECRTWSAVVGKFSGLYRELARSDS